MSYSAPRPWKPPSHCSAGVELQFPASSGDDRYSVLFSQTFGYDQLGNPTSYGYPQCQTTPQNGRRRCEDGPNDVVAPSLGVA